MAWPHYLAELAADEHDGREVAGMGRTGHFLVVARGGCVLGSL